MIVSLIVVNVNVVGRRLVSESLVYLLTVRYISFILYNIKDEVAWKSLDIFLLSHTRRRYHSLSFIGQHSHLLSHSSGYDLRQLIDQICSYSTSDLFKCSCAVQGSK